LIKSTISSSLIGLLLLAGSATVLAQDGERFRVIPVHMYAYKYNENMGPADLDKATEKWNAWADSQGVDDYTAWTLTPYYFGPEQGFGLFWLGADFERMGNSGGYKGSNELFSELLDRDSNRAYIAENRRFIQLR